MESEGFFQIFGVQICTTPIRRFCNTLERSDGLALQIRRFLVVPADGFFTTQFPMDFDYQNQASCGTRKI